MGGASSRILERGTFDRQAYADELLCAADNRRVGTTELFEKRSGSGLGGPRQARRAVPFHAHDHHYFWTCVRAGLGRQRSPDGSVVVRRYEEAIPTSPHPVRRCR